MPDVTVERRNAGVSRTGCYIDTLNPIPHGSQVRVRITHENETFEATARIVYGRYGLGMGVAFTEVAPEQQQRLHRWLEAANR